MDNGLDCLEGMDRTSFPGEVTSEVASDKWGGLLVYVGCGGEEGTVIVGRSGSVDNYEVEPEIEQ